MTTEPVLLQPKTKERPGKILNLTTMRTFLLASRAPKSVRYQDSMPHIEGLPTKERPADIAWGVHGNRSISDASVYYSRAALDEGKTLYEIELNLRIDNLRQSTVAVDEDIAKASGLITCGRLKAGYAAEIHATIMGYLEESKLPRTYLDAAREMSLDDLLVQFPSAVWRYLRERPWLRAFVHPALVRVADANDRRAAVSTRLQIITFRIDPERLEQNVVRQLPNVPITI